MVRFGLRDRESQASAPQPPIRTWLPYVKYTLYTVEYSQKLTEVSKETRAQAVVTSWLVNKTADKPLISVTTCSRIKFFLVDFMRYFFLVDNN